VEVDEPPSSQDQKKDEKKKTPVQETKEPEKEILDEWEEVSQTQHVLTDEKDEKDEDEEEPKQMYERGRTRQQGEQ